VLQQQPAIERLVHNRWIWLACLDPDSAALWELTGDGFRPHGVDQILGVVTGDSATWYQGKRGFLAPVSIVPPAVASGASAS
jgi:hypothetical protein